MHSRTQFALFLAAASTALAVSIIALAGNASPRELSGYALFFFSIQVAATSQRNQKRCSG